MAASFRFARPLSALACAATLLCAPQAHAADAAPIKVAFIDQLSGPLSNVGEQFLANIKLAIDDANAQPQGVLSGARYELSTYDNKLSAQDSLSALQSAIDAGAKIVFTGVRARPWWRPWSMRPPSTTSAIRPSGCSSSTTRRSTRT